MDDASEFLISIVVEAIDRAGPTLAKVAGEIEALKRLAGEERVRGHPTAGLQKGLEQTSTAADSATSSISQHREEVTRDTQAVDQNTQAVDRNRRSLDDHTRSVDQEISKEQRLAETAAKLDDVYRQLNDAIESQAKLTREQEAEASRLVTEYNALARAYAIGTEEARQYGTQAKVVQDILTANRERVRALSAEYDQQNQALNRVAQAQQRETDAQVTSMRKQEAEHEALSSRIQNTINTYENFRTAMRDGRMDINEAVIGYRQMSRELDGVSRSFDSASPAAIKFANAARMAREEATRLIGVAAAGGGDRGGGRGGLGALLMGGGGIAGTAAFGSLGGFAGLGFEHLLMTGVGLTGSAVGGLMGGGLLGSASLATTAVGGGADMAVMKSTIADTSTLYKQLQTNQQNVAAAQAQVNAAIAQYGKNSQQAASAQQSLSQAQTAANQALHYQMQQLGPAAGAELALAKQVQNLNTHWDQATAKAREAGTHILGQLVGVAYGYVQLIANAADRNFKIIDQHLRPLLQYLDGPGKQIFKDLENIFASRLPTSVHAFTQALELVSKIIDYVAKTFLHGQFIDAVDKFFTKWNDPTNWGKVTHSVDHLVSLFESWKNFIEILVKDIYQLFHADAGTGQTIVDTLTKMLDKLHAWEVSTRGQAQIHNLFTTHKNEVVAFLNVLGPLLQAFGRFELTVGPPLTRVMTLFLGLAGKILNWFVNLGNEVGGPFKTAFTDGVLIPLGAFLIAWKAWDFSTAVSRFRMLANVLVNPLSLLRQIGTAVIAMVRGFQEGEGVIGRFSGAWGGLKGGFGGGGAAAAADPAVAMRAAFEEGGATAAEVMAAAIVEAGSEAAGEMAIGVAGGAGIPAARDLLGSLGAAESGPGAAILARAGVPTGLGSQAASLADAAAPGVAAGAAAAGVAPEVAAGAGGATLAGMGALGVGALTTGGLGLAMALPFLLPLLTNSGFESLPHDYATTTGTGLAKLLGPVGPSRQLPQDPGKFSFSPSGGAGSLSAGETSTNLALKGFQSQLQGISNPAALSTGQLTKLYNEAQKLQSMPDITAKMRANLEQVAKAVDPVNVAIEKADATWGAAFKDINATTSNVMAQVQQLISEQMVAINENLTKGTAQWHIAITANYGGAIAELKSLNSQGLISTQKMVSDINQLLAQELTQMGASKTVTAAIGAHGIAAVGGAQIVATGATGRYEEPQSGGKIIQVAEGGYPEVVLTTDPKHAKRQRSLLSQYLKAAPQVLHGSYAAGGTVESYGALESLWMQAGGPSNMAALMAAISEAESGGNVYAHNASGASGLWQILGVPFPGNPFDALTNARMAVAKWRSQGLGAWTTFTSGAYKQYLDGAVPPSALGSYAATIKQPKWTGPGGDWSVLGNLVGKDVTQAANTMLSHYMSTLGGAGAGGAAGGGPPSKIGRYTFPLPSGVWHSGSLDQGWDIAAPGNTPLYAIGPGTITGHGISGFGSWAPILRLDSGGAAYYGHAGPSGELPVGTHVSAGQKIGTVGPGIVGISTGPHLEIGWYPPGSGSGASMKSALGYMMGGFIPAARGFEGIVNNPTMFLAGEGGQQEHVAITPKSQTSAQTGGFFTPSSSVPYSQVNQFLQSIQNLSSGGGSQALAPQDINNAINNLYSGLTSTVTNLTKFMNYLDQITAQGGPLDQLDQAVQALFTQMSDKITQSALKVRTFTAPGDFATGSSGGVGIAPVRRGQPYVAQTVSPAQQDAETIAAYLKEYAAIGGEQTTVSHAETSVGRQLSEQLGIPEHQLSKMTPLQIQSHVQQMPTGSVRYVRRGNRRVAVRTPANVNQRTAHRLALEYGNLYGRSNTLSDQRAQTLSSLYQEEGTQLSDTMTGIQDTKGTQADILNTQFTQMQNLGTLGAGNAGSRIASAIVGNANSQIAQYTKVLQTAQREGNKDVAAQAQQQIDQLKQSISSVATQLLQAQVDYFNQQAQYQTNALQRQSSFATNVVAKGVQGVGGAAQTLAAQMQLGVLQQTGTAYRGQLSQAQGFYRQAEAQGNTQLANQLLDQIGQLTENIAENTQAISDQIVAVRQTTIAFINSTTQFKTGVFGTLYGALQTIGQIQGGLNVPAAISATQGSINALSGANTGLIAKLSEATGGQVNLQGLSGTSLINALMGIPTSQIESGMTQAQITQFEGLITQISSNEAALEQNTQQLMTLNGQLMQPQTFSSTAWTNFRSAIFNGMGALLPAYAAAATGSLTNFPQPSSISSTNTGITNNINIANPAGAASSPQYLGAAIAWSQKTANP